MLLRSGWKGQVQLVRGLSAGLVVLTCAVQLCSSQGSPQLNLTECCHLIPEEDVDCHQPCTEGNEDQVFNLCPGYYQSFWSCIWEGPDQGITEPPPTVHDHVLTEGLKCCEQDTERSCRTGCAQVLRAHRHLTTEQVLSDLRQHCSLEGSVTSSPLVQCLTSTYSREIANVPHFPDLQLNTMDYARLFCCFKAVSSGCRNDCIRYHLDPTPESRTLFREECLLSAGENVLYSCFEDVTGPSRPGCKTSGFCSMFANRPADMFRHCGNEANMAAHREYTSWVERGEFVHGYLGTTLRLGEVASCLPDYWKTWSCLLHVQPTDASHHTAQLCRSDCLLLMRSCADPDLLARRGLTVESVCSQLSPQLSSCQPLQPFVAALRQPPPQNQAAGLRYPCNGHSCGEGEVCVVNQDCGVQQDGLSCQTFTCIRGCHIGLVQDSTSISVPAYQVQKLMVPLLPYAKTSQLCHAYHTCRNHANLHTSASGLGQQNFTCRQLLHCRVDGQSLAHNQQLQDGCNRCVCRHGNLLCTNWTCTDQTTALVIFDCQGTVMPSCGRRGSASSYSCVPGSQEEEAGRGASCAVVGGEGCPANQCPANTSCMGSLGPCVASLQGQCEQFECVTTASCWKYGPRPVCSTGNETFSDVCSLATACSHFNYWGRCKPECSDFNPVCGADGVTYHTPCHAHSLRVAVDYEGRCLRGCGQVKCPSLPTVSCTPFKAPGACCPQCGGLLTVLVDSLEMTQDLPNMGMASVRVADVMSRLEDRVNTLGCRVTGYLSPNSNDVLVVVVQPQATPTSAQQVEGCSAEAAAILSRVNQESVYHALDGVLTHLASAQLSNDITYYHDYHEYLRSHAHAVMVLSWQLISVAGLSVFLSTVFWTV